MNTIHQTKQELFKAAPCQPNSYPGYPEQRLVARDEAPALPADLPEGPWSTALQELPSESEQLAFKQQGLMIDSLGRPLHPRLTEMLLEQSGGVVTNKGFFRRWGPNRTGDPIIITQNPKPCIALVQRKDSGAWALPGGFVDPSDGSDPLEAGLNAAVREAHEEIGLDLFNLTGRLVCQVVVDDFRATAHAWPETTAVLIRPAATEKLEPDYNEVLDAAWFPITRMPRKLHGSHHALIRAAIDIIKEEDDEQ